jgi:formamidopyrimidine-DNA glycosylase
MPELPDVESYRRYLSAKGLHKRIRDVHVGNTTILRGVTSRGLKQALRGRQMERTRRHGKHLFALLDDGTWLAMHFGMTGRLAYFKRLEDDPEHDRLRLDLANGYHLAFDDTRMLGRVRLISDPDDFIAAEKLGPDALDASLDKRAFVRLMKGRKGRIKSALMDQTLLAGIGNIYTDEILFQARLHPNTLVQRLSDEELRALHKTIRRVLKVAIERGAGSEQWVDRLPAKYLLRHREAGATCPRCRGMIKRSRAGGRSFYYCPRCQPARR